MRCRSIDRLATQLCTIEWWLVSKRANGKLTFRGMKIRVDRVMMGLIRRLAVNEQVLRWWLGQIRTDGVKR